MKRFKLYRKTKEIQPLTDYSFIKEIENYNEDKVWNESQGTDNPMREEDYLLDENGMIYYADWEGIWHTAKRFSTIEKKRVKAESEMLEGSDSE